MLRVLAGPGCDEIGKLDYVKSRLGPDDVIISAGRIFVSLTASDAIPSSNSAALRMALGLRTVAIRQAREKELSGFVLTSNGTRRDLDRLVSETGSEGALIMKMTEQQACARIAKLVPAGERRAACELGVRGRWFGRYVAAGTDREVEP